ncbi:MAG: ATP-binding cassette domain-containing protein, partial [Planctomycetaceae bacterium]|nr:ATP-binding cassette domain-containing protein [Planctomycetaceae bacterium]
SGAGKSTLLMHLNGLLPEKIPSGAQAAAEAVITVCGIPLVKDDLNEIRRLVGFLFQDPDDQLFCPTVREDVAFGPLNLGLASAEVLERVRSSLDEVGLPDFGERSTLQLSFGERKRVCLAGVFACQPSLLVLDEPSSNLDPRARKNLLRILRGFEGGQLIATHDLDLIVELCDRVIVLDEGKVHADGSPEQVLSDQSLMEQHGLEVPLRLKLGKSAVKPG